MLLVYYPFPHICNEIGCLIVHLCWKRQPFCACNFENIVCAHVSHSWCRMQGGAHCDVGSSFVGTVSISNDVTAAVYPKDGDSSCLQNLVLSLQSAWLHIPDNIDFPVHCRKNLTSRLMWPVLNYATVLSCT
jgi:hypothetical protein